jgi:sortase (surface protein transpeptidase)
MLTIQSSSTAEAQAIPETTQETLVEETQSEPEAQPAEEPTITPTSASTAAPQPAPATTPAPAYDSVSIPSLGFSSRYVTVGTTASNAIDVHPSLVGWWNRSAQPGSPGAIFLDGHNPGVFSKLPNIAVGANISITKASGETFQYTVIEREIVPLVGINMRKALSVQGGASEGLNLMTCMGTYNPNTGTTDQRLVVYAIRS